MKFTILTLFPEMFQGFLENSIIHRAIERQIVSVNLMDFRANSTDKHRKVDDKPYGGAPGMILAVQPIADTLKQIRTPNSITLLISPEGETFNQAKARQMAEWEYDQIILICGHYEGFDARIEHYIDGKISLGDFILTGGEIPAMAIVDAVTRLLPGAIKKDSNEDESFENGLLECPQYTMPAEYDGYRVPDTLLSGNHKEIQKWRLKQSLSRTMRLRPDLLENRVFNQEEIKLVDELREENRK